MEQRVIDKVIELINIDIDKKEQAAAWAGAMGDNGASQLRREAEIWLSGWNEEFPAVWKKYIQQAQNELDPDYVKYLELKKRFEKG